MNTGEKLYTVVEVSRLLRLQPETVREQIRRGRLSAYGIGGNGVKAARYVISAAHLEDYLTKFEKRATAV